MTKTARTNQSLLFIILVGVSILLVAALILLFASGFRLNRQATKPAELFSQMGVIAATSIPKSADIYINDKLSGVTDNTLVLDPKNTQVRIQKDGFLPWQKSYQLKPQVVFTTNANLFRAFPQLEPATLSGVSKLIGNPNGNFALFTVASASSSLNNGLYSYSFTSSPLSLIQDNPKQLAPNFATLVWSDSQLELSPDESHLLVTYKTKTYLVKLDGRITLQSLVETSPTLVAKTKEAWQAQLTKLTTAQLDKLPPALAQIISTNSAHFQFNLSQEKILYQVSKPQNFPDLPTVQMPAHSTQTQTKALTPGNWYVYDLLDDSNFFLQSASNVQYITWLPTSDNLIFTTQDTIYSIEYDATNLQKLYAGQIYPNLFYTAADGKYLTILLSPYSGSTPNLYKITIR